MLSNPPDIIIIFFASPMETHIHCDEGIVYLDFQCMVSSQFDVSSAKLANDLYVMSLDGYLIFYFPLL